MLKSVPLVLLLTTSVITLSNCQSDEIPECGLNQVFRVCAIPCLPTCAKPNPPQCRPRRCMRKCQCDYGYVEDNSGNCVLPEDCTDSADNGETENRRRRHLNTNGPRFAKWRAQNDETSKISNF